MTLKRALSAGAINAQRGLMKTAVVFSIPAAVAAGFGWKWRASDGTKQSRSTFAYFYDCVESARAAGYTVKLNTARDKNADGSQHHGLA